MKLQAASGEQLRAQDGSASVATNGSNALDNKRYDSRKLLFYALITNTGDKLVILFD